jgi:hypothetical protein
MSKMLVAVAAATIVAAGAALAAGEFASGDRLNACAKEESGLLRLVAEGAECLPSELAVSWSAGGVGGATSFETVTTTVPATPGLTTGTAACSAGGRVVGGGAHADPVAGGNVLADYPVGDSAWTAAAATNPAAQSLTVYAICATGS